MITLDSVYFQAGSRVQCAARAVNSNGEEGLELSSPIVTISQEEGEETTTNAYLWIKRFFIGAKCNLLKWGGVGGWGAAKSSKK